MLLQVFRRARRLDLIHMGIRLFDAVVLRDDRRRRLLSDPRHTRNIVRGIAPQCLDINELCRRHLLLFYDILRKIMLDLRSRPLGLGDGDLDMLCRKLQQIPVARKDHDLLALCSSTGRQRPQYVVRLQASLLDRDDPHRL